MHEICRLILYISYDILKPSVTSSQFLPPWEVYPYTIECLMFVCGRIRVQLVYSYGGISKVVFRLRSDLLYKSLRQLTCNSYEIFERSTQTDNDCEQNPYLKCMHTIRMNKEKKRGNYLANHRKRVKSRNIGKGKVSLYISRFFLY